MKKKISFSTLGQRADIGNMTIYRLLPNRYADAVGPFVFLDHIAPEILTSANKEGTGPHPHRGIATLTYIFNGEDEHTDSAGNHAIVHSGGVQWMKAGSGIIHDESLSCDTNTGSKLIHGVQFWINLPSKIKAEKPEYLAVEGKDLSIAILGNQSGWIKVILGQYEGLRSIIPDYTNQFLFHIYLEAGKQFSLNLADETEAAAFSPLKNITINDAEFSAGEFVEFDRKAGIIELTNSSDSGVDMLLFGGETYNEPIFADGPFVMNSKVEIADAYRDFFAGKYGEIVKK